MAKKMWNYIKKKSRKLSEEEYEDISVNQNITSIITAPVEVVDHLLKTFKYNVVSAGNTTHDVFQYLINANNINLTVQLIQYIENINLQDENGNTLLHLAAEKNNYLICNALIVTEKPDINIVNKEGKSVLHVASEVGCFVALKQILLQRPVDVNIRDYLKFTPLHYALLNGHDEVAMLLLSYGADLNMETYRKESGYHLAFAKNCQKVIKKIETERRLENIKMVDFVTIYGNSILHYIDSVILLNKLWNADTMKLRNQPNYRQDTPLYYACARGNSALLRFFIEIKNSLVGDNIGENLIHMAVRKNLSEMIPTLRRIYSGNEINKFGMNCFESALIHGYDKLALAIKNTENPNDYVNDFHGNTSSHYAAIGCETLSQILNLQLDPDNENFFIPNKYGMFPYLYLILYNKQTILNYLFDENRIQSENENKKKTKRKSKKQKKGKKEREIEKEQGKETENEEEKEKEKDKEKEEKNETGTEKEEKGALLYEKAYCVNTLSGNTSLHYAVKSKSPEMLKFVCSRLKSHLNMPNNKGQTPLYLAAIQNDEVMVEYLLKKYSEAQILVSKNDPILVDCIKYNSDPKLILLSMLLNAGCNINCVVNRATALILAVEKQNEKLVKFLLSRNANVHVPVLWRPYINNSFRDMITENHSNTLLHVAAEKDNSEITRALLLYGAQKMINEFNSYGVTPLHCALIEKQYSQVSLLLKHGADYDLPVKLSNDTPLHLAARSGPIDIVNLLIKYRPKVSANNNKNTPDFIAAAKQPHAIFKLVYLYMMSQKFN